MRYLIDTNIFVYLALDIEMLSRDVKAILEEPDTLLYISAESVRELIVGYRNKGLCSKRWKTVEAMVAAIENEFYVQILPVKKEHMETYARMEINEAQGHKDSLHPAARDRRKARADGSQETRIREYHPCP